MVFRKDGLPIRTNFAVRGLHQTSEEHQIIRQSRPDYIKVAKWEKYAREISVTPSRSEK